MRHEGSYEEGLALFTSIKRLRTTAKGRSLGVVLVTLVLFGACAEVAGLKERHSHGMVVEPVLDVDRMWASRSTTRVPRQNWTNDVNHQEDANIGGDKNAQWVWRRVIDEKTFTWEDAHTYCKDLVAAGDQ